MSLYRAMKAAKSPRKLRIPGSARAHSHLVAACRTLLTLHKIPSVAINQVAHKTSKGWKTQGATVGCFDIIACLPGGRVLALDAKTGSGKLSLAQLEFEHDWMRAGALCRVIRSVDELDSLLREVVR